MRRAAAVVMATALAAVDGQRTDCSASAFLSGIQMYCPSDHLSCPRGCADFLTRRLGDCPGISASLSAADRTFLTRTCHKTDAPAPAPAAAGTNFYALSAVDIEGNEVQFSQYMGKVSLVVNVAQF